MRQRVGHLVRQAQQTLPEGTGVVGAGLAVAAVTSYMFVIVALNALDGTAKNAFSAYWAVIFVAGPGLFLPLEQEIGRALAHRRAQGVGGGPLVHRAARLGGIMTAVIVVVALASTPLLNHQLYHGDMLFPVALAIGLVGFYTMHLTRGVLAGEGRFRAYGELIAAEGVLRLTGGLVLAGLGVGRAGGYAMVLALAPFLAVAFALRRQRGLLRPGPAAPYSELSASLGWLLLASVFTQLLAYSPLLAVNLLAQSPSEKAVATAFASAFFVSRVPVLAFQAVQGTLLPKLAGLAGSGRHGEFRRGVKRLGAVVVGIAVLGTVLAFTVGPEVGKILFKDFSLSAGGLALLAAGSGAFIIALTLAQALMALGGHRSMTLSWGVGLATCVAVISVISDLELRVELGFVTGALVAGVVMGVFTWIRMAQAEDSPIESLIEALEHEPIEI